MPISQLLIETDLLADYLVARPGESSLLRRALSQVQCYTTMLNALELFRAAESAVEREAVRAILTIVRVLGFPARTAEVAADLFAVAKVNVTTRESVILGLAHASKLSILTQSHFERYKTLAIVPVFDALPMEPSA